LIYLCPPSKLLIKLFNIMERTSLNIRMKT
jgi:hypothetical protein